ncbi:MAG TPA: DNA replication/repair protein RecF [Acidimicrobiia bacterium]|nr:DNA replication/repair protein RecF [Acidimicrobiia bacterium]
MLAESETRSITRVAHLWLDDFRCLRGVDLDLDPGLTVIHGANGQGKTSLLEAIAWIARAHSFRGVTDAPLVRRGCDHAIVRAEIYHDDRLQLFEAELHAVGRNRVQCNKRSVTRARDLHGLLRIAVFAPDDLELIKGGPATRRVYLDELLGMLAVRYEAARGDFERVLKQRNALLRTGVRDPSAVATLDVFDEQLVAAAAELVRGRLQLVDRLGPTVNAAYAALADDGRTVTATYEAEWAPKPPAAGDAGDVDELLRTAFGARRRAEIERGVTLVGPHRDDWKLTIDDLDARSQASQGEQRSLALALRLAGREVVHELTGTPPVLLLDDVFSELDARRSSALIRNLPAGQTLLTTAGAIPADVKPDQVLRINAGRVEAAAR